MDNKIPYILIVDDDANLLGTMSDILKMKGFEPVIAPTGAAALVQIERHHFDLALVDLRLDDMSGLIVLRAIKTHSPETECILLTGHASQDTAIEAIQMGVYGYFQKPFDMEQVLLSIQRALEKTAAGKALRESERFAHATVDALSSHLAILDETGTVLAVNRAWRKFAQTNFTGDHRLKLCEGVNYLTVCDTSKGKDSEEASAMAAGVRSVMSGSQNEFSLEYPCHSPEEKRWFIARVTRFPGEGPLRIVVAHENITERKLAEEKIAQTEKRYRSLIENAPDGVVMVGVDGKYKYASPAALRVFNYSIEDGLESNPVEQTHPEDLPMVLGVLQDIIENPSKVPTIQYRFLHKNGSWRWVESTFTNLLAEPSVEAIVINFRDITERKQAEEAQQQSELQFRALFDLSPDAVMLIDPYDPDISWPIIDCNEVACQMNGYRRDELIGSSVDIVNISPATQDERNAYIKQIREAGNLKVETFHRHKNGAIFTVEVSTALVKIGDRELLIGIDRDITERKQAEENLRKSESLFASLFHANPTRISITRLEDSRFLDVNETFLKSVGYTREEVVGHTSSELNDWVDPQERFRLRDLLEGQDRVKDFETQLRRKSGDIMDVLISAELIELFGETCILSVGLDITERKRAEEKIRILSRAVEQSPASIVITDVLGNVEYVNPKFLQVTGYGVEELLGRNPRILQSGYTTQEEYKKMWDTITSGNVWRGEFLNKKKNSEIYWENATIAPVFNDAGRIINFLAVKEDVTERKQAEEALRQAEANYRSIFENALEGIFQSLPQGRFSAVNPAFAHMLGYESPDELIETITDIASQVYVEAPLRAELIQKLVEQKTVTRFEYQMKRKDGGTIWVSESVRAVYDENGGLRYYEGSTEDITERKQANEALLESEKRYRTIFDGVQDAIFIETIDGSILEVNKSACEMYGYKRDELLTKTVSDFVLEGSFVFAPHLNPNKSSAPMETINRRANGEIFPIEISGGVQVISGEEVLLAIVRDITERKHAELALGESQRRLTTLMANLPGMAFRCKNDWEWNMEFVSEGCILLTGYHPAELINNAGIAYGQIIHAEDRQMVWDAIQAKLENKQPYQLNYRIITANGEERWVWEQGQGVYETDGVLLALEGFISDITERKKAEDELIQSEERFRQLANNIEETFWITDASSGKEIYISPAAEKVWGIPVENLYQGRYLFLETILPEDRQLALNVLERQSHGEKTEMEYRIQHPDGSVRWVWDRAFPILDETGKVLRVAGLAADITERKKSEEAQHESEQKYRTLFDEMLSGVAVHEIICDEQGKPIDYRFLSINAAFEKMTGLTAAEVIGKTVLEVLPATEELWIENYGHVALTGVPAQFENYSSEVDKYFEVRAFSPEKGKFATIFNDITERKRAEMALKESESLYRQAIEVAGAVPYLQSYTGKGTGLHYDFIGEGIYQITGYEAGEFNAALWDEFTEESVLLGDLAGSSMAEAIQRVRSGEIPLWKCEHRIRARDGKIHWVFESAVELYDEHGVAKGSIGMFQDITERKKAEEALQESEERFRVIFEKANDAIHIEDANDKILAVNSRMCELMGYSREELLKMHVADLQAPERRQLGGVLKREFVKNSSAIFEALNLHRDGRLIPVEVSIGIIERPSGNLYISVLRDITERKQAERNIRQRVRELELLYQSGLVFSQMLNPKQIAQKIIDLLGEKLDWHHTTIRLLRTQDELELVAFDQPGLGDKAAVEAHFNNLITHVGQGLSGWALQQSKTIRLGDVNSDPHYVATYPGLHSGLYVPLKSGDHVLGVISIESEQPDAFSEADEQLLTTLANQAANAFENARLYQTARQEITERKRVENLLAEERNQLAHRVEERTADLSRVNADLAHAVRVKDEFLASMSHELRTPLTGILGLSEVLQLKIYGELNDKQITTVKNIEESGRHLLELINDILDLSKIEAGKLELQFAPYSLADICQASLQLIKGMSQHKHQHVNYSFPAEPIIIRADARRVKQLLVNLLSNAIKFTPENGELGLEVEAIQSERKIKLTVWDKGIGIKPEDLSRLFKPFTQLDSGLAREYSGTGLGLSLVQHLTELHNGGIEVESDFGKGSRFTVILPWSPQNTTPIPYTMQRGNTGGLHLPAISPENSKAPMVMYVDDNEMVLQMVGDFLEAKQYRVIKVRSGLELLERAAEHHPNIMLVDIQMPGIGGMETIRRIRAHPDPLVAAAPIIAVTALAMPADRERCLRAGANDYMSKPLKLKELAAAIQRLLERKP